jgi:hypothetical protein
VTVLTKAAGFRELISPGHEVIGRLMATVGQPALSAEDVTGACRGFTWVGVRTMTSFEEIERTKKGNCLGLASLMGSLAVALGWTKSRVLVSGGGLLSRSLLVTEGSAEAVTVHAWAILVPPCGDGAIVDPMRMVAEDLGDASDFEARLKFAAPVDRIYPVIAGPDGWRICSGPRQAHGYLVSLWKS